MRRTMTALEESLYETDFYSWTQRQAELIRSDRLSEVDLPNLLEEIESLGRAQYHALRSSYRLVTMHLLKMRHQPERLSASWTSTIARERNAIEDTLADSPGLRPKRAEAYAGARCEAAAETGFTSKVFSATCPFTLDEVEDHDFWPQAMPL